MTWDWKHQQVIIEQLRKVTTGDCKRLMIFLPPRHGKSELVSVRYTAWRMQQDPSMNVILGSYNQRLADRMSRKIRTVVCDAEAWRADTPVRMSVASTRRKDVNDPDSSIGHNSFAGGTGDADKSVRAPSDWISNLLDELTAFPNATHDDQIDAISIAVHMHSSKPNRAGGFLIT